jgi:hypothetical protein
MPRRLAKELYSCNQALTWLQLGVEYIGILLPFLVKNIVRQNIDDLCMTRN